MLATKSSSLFVLLCVVGFTTAGINRIFEFESNAPKIQVRNSLLTGLACNKTEPGPTQKCKIYQSVINNESNFVSCEVVLDKNLWEVDVFPITARKALLMYTNDHDKEQYIQYSIVNFTDCKTSDIHKINFERFLDSSNVLIHNSDAILVNENGTFDVLTTDDKLCNDKICRLTFDDQGHQVRGPVFSFVPLTYARRLVTKIPPSSNFVVREVDQLAVYRISLMKDDRQIVLKETNSGLYELEQHDVSTSHGLIRLCSTAEKSKIIDCEVFDDKGKSKSKISVNATQNVDTVAVQNLASGFLLQINGLYKNKGVVMKVKDDGSVLGTTEILDFICNPKVAREVSEVDQSNDQFCITRVCIKGGMLKIVKECLADVDFH